MEHVKDVGTYIILNTIDILNCGEGKVFESSASFLKWLRPIYRFSRASILTKKNIEKGRGNFLKPSYSNFSLL